MSNHNPKIFVAWVSEEIRRYRRLCSDNKDYYYSISQLYHRLTERGYNLRIFSAAFLQSQKQPQGDDTTLLLGTVMNSIDNINSNLNLIHDTVLHDITRDNNSNKKTDIWVPFRTPRTLKPLPFSEIFTYTPTNGSKEEAILSNVIISRAVINHPNVGSYLLHSKFSNNNK